MTEHKHEDLRRLFDLAIAAAPGDRGPLLDCECGGDTGLKKRVEAMIAAAEDDRFLSEPTHGHYDSLPTSDSSAAAETLAAPLREGPGTRIGPYKLLQLIGEGGFGSVFMAEQEKPVARKVALKIIKLGMDTRQVVARFEQERQALAMMDHPNIARVLDAGATDTGRPFFVMELVKGDPIVEYCDKNNLSIEDRLELFAQVCNAVQHAHTKGIIHRDIKPSNILVSTQDGRPHTKVIDFGIAKATASKLTEKTLFTEHKALIGTPEYMSPEQAEGNLDIDTRTDVYSLGVLLYELLTGTTPFTGKELRSAAFGEIQRIIREVEPPKPSTRLSANIDTIASVAAKRHTEPKRLGTVVRGELDWIVMKALEKDRQRRYETANGLAMDIRRYLSGEAVVAAPPSTAYRMKKFIKRHRGVVIATGVVAAALVLGVVGTSMGLMEARKQRSAAEQSGALASEEAARAAKAESIAKLRLAESEATVGFLDEMLGAVDPTAQGKDVTVRKVLDGASKSLGERFADRPLVAARLHGTIGRTYLGLGVYDQSEPHIREQIRIRSAELGPDHEDTCKATNDLGALLVKNGKYADAETLLKDAIAKHERLFGRRHEVTLMSIDELTTLYTEQGRGDEAEPLLRESLEARRSKSQGGTWESLATMNSLATVLADKASFAEAESLFEEAVRASEKLGKGDHPFALEIRGNFAWMEYWAGSQERKTNPDQSKKRMERARVLGEEVYEAKLRVLGEEHQSTLSTMSNLCSVYVDRGMLDQAEILRRKELAITERILGADHPDTQISLANVGALLRKRGRFEEAIVFLERSIQGSRKAFPPDYEGTGFTLGWYGSCLSKLGRHADAEKALIEARTIVAKTMGDENPITREVTRDLVNVYEAWEKAEPGKGHAAAAAEWKGKLDAMGSPAQGTPPAGKK
jgi:tetratricopeptide (TPR) repeat protein